jgi:RNA polymerase sigma factor for flagellar operon FliA
VSTALLPPTATSDDLVTATLPLVGHVVRQTLSRVPRHVTRDELMSAGMLALVQAASSFDPERGVSFGAYAATRIRGAIIDELRGLDWASRSVRRREREVEESRNTLATALGRVPTDQELAQALGVSVDELGRHREDISRAAVLSLNGFAEADADDLLPAVGLTPERVLEQRERIAYLRDGVANLPERLRVVVEGYYFADRPMAELAEELGVTESRVSQLRAEAVALLKGALVAALDSDPERDIESPKGCAARRKEAYYASVAAHRSFTARLAATEAGTYTA